MFRRAVLVGLTGMAVAVGFGLGPRAAAQEKAAATPLNIIAFGAHPDDCDIRAGGIGAPSGRRPGTACASCRSPTATPATSRRGAAPWPRGAGRRRREAGRRIGVDYIVLDNHDGELMPELHVREQIIRLIREWKADLVLGPRPNDYHPDHRYTGVLLPGRGVHGDRARTSRPTRRRCDDNPVFMYFEDHFQKPLAVRARRRRVDRRRDREEARHDRRARVADVRVAAVAQRRRWTRCRRSRRRGASGSGSNREFRVEPRRSATCW